MTTVTALVRRWSPCLAAALLGVALAPSPGRTQALPKPVPVAEPVTDAAKLPEKGPHGGTLIPSGQYVMEFTTDNGGVNLYLLDAKLRTLDLRMAQAAATIMYSFGNRRMLKFRRIKDFFRTNLVMADQPDFTMYVNVRNGPVNLYGEYAYKAPPKPQKPAKPAAKSPAKPKTPPSAPKAN